MESEDNQCEPMRVTLDNETKKIVLDKTQELKKLGMSFKEITKVINDKFALSLSVNALNALYWRYGSPQPSKIDFPDSDESKINEDGVFRDSRYFEVDINEPMGVNDILLAHGLDPEEFEIVTTGSTGSKIGTSANDEQYFINTYRKLTARPRSWKPSKDDLREILKDTNLQKVSIESRKHTSKARGLYEIPIFDAHFGVARYEDYKNHQAEIFKYIQSEHWEEVLFVIGQDLFHNDDFRGRTSKGTPIERVDMERAVCDAKAFYYPLIEEALRQSDKVKIIYSRGNHDESMGWFFVNLLGEKYPQVEIDGGQKEYKRHVYHDVFLGYTHGDKVKNDSKIIKTFNGMYRLDMAHAKIRIIKRGHFHHMAQLDDDGVIVMGLGSAVPTDEYSENHGYTYSHKTFQTFIYTKDGVKAQIYIGG